MEARLFINPKTTRPRSSYETILDWMQKNPNLCRKTNAVNIAKAISLKQDNIFATNTLKQAINKMVDNQMLYRFNGIRKADFRINYLHRMIPQSILDTAPQEALNYRNNTIGKVKSNQHLDEVGCIVTPGIRKKEEEPKEEVTITKPETPATVSQEETEKVSSDMSEENTVSTPVEIKATEHGISISITLNLNINK